MAAAAGQVGQLILIILYNAVLARLLTPRDFGLVAMATVMGGFLQVMKDAGLGTATIQARDITQAQISNLFWINAAVGLGAMLLMAAGAPLVALFFHQRELVPIAVSLSLIFLVDGFAAQHVAVLARGMRLTSIATIDFASSAVGCVVGTLMAISGFGYWSLVGASIFTAFVRLATAWSASGWRPQRPTPNSGTNPLLRFGAHLTLVGLVYAVARGTDSVLIGRLLGSDALGTYSRATMLLQRPLERAASPIYAVMVPALSRLQHDPLGYRSLFLHVFEFLALSVFIVVGFLLPMTPPLIAVFLGERWAPVAPVFAGLTPAAFYLMLAPATSWLYTSQGRGRELLTAACVSTGAMIASLSIGVRFGLAGTAIAFSASGLLISLPLTFYMAGRRGPVGTSALWRALLRHWPVFAVVLGASWSAHALLNGAVSPHVELLLCTPISILVSGATLLSSRRNRHLISRLRVAFNDYRRGRHIL